MCSLRRSSLRPFSRANIYFRIGVSFVREESLLKVWSCGLSFSSLLSFCPKVSRSCTRVLRRPRLCKLPCPTEEAEVLQQFEKSFTAEFFAIRVSHGEVRSLGYR